MEPCPVCGRTEFKNANARGGHVGGHRRTKGNPPATISPETPPPPPDLELKFSELETKLSGQLTLSLTKIEAEVAKFNEAREAIPGMVADSVTGFMQAIVESKQGQPNPGNPPGNSQGQAQGILSKINWPRALGLAFGGETKNGEPDVDKIVAGIMRRMGGDKFGGFFGSHKSRSLSPEAAYSRGRGQALSALRLKKSDPIFGALAMREEATRELANTKLAAGKREWYKGQLDTSNAFLKAEELSREKLNSEKPPEKPEEAK